MITSPTILLVEDNPRDAVKIRRALSQISFIHSLYEVPDGNEAILYLSGEGPYSDRQEYPLPLLVFLDLRLPTVDGFEVLRWIRDREELRNVRVVIFSASTDPKDSALAYRLGAFSYQIKSADMEQTVLMLMTVLQSLPPDSLHIANGSNAVT